MLFPKRPRQVLCYAGLRLTRDTWTQHYISTLFAATALNGAAKSVKVLCNSCNADPLHQHCGCIQERIDEEPIQGTTENPIEIGGIGSMVYAFLAVTTPMHDLLVNIALLSFLAAALATLQMQHAVRQTTLVLFGMACLALLAVCAVMYYGNVLLGVLPVAQKQKVLTLNQNAFSKEGKTLMSRNDLIMKAR